MSREDNIYTRRNISALVCVAGNNNNFIDISNNKNYDISIEYNKDYKDLSAAKFLNQMSSKRNYDLLIYMTDEFNFCKGDSLEKLIFYFTQDKFSHIGAMYSDVDIHTISNSYMFTKYYKSYNKDMYLDRTIINIPFIVKSSVLPTFDEEIEKLCLWDGLLWLMRNTILHHIPYPIFKAISNEKFKLHDIDKEIKKIASK